MVCKLTSSEKPKVAIMATHFGHYGFTWITQTHGIFYSHLLRTHKKKLFRPRRKIPTGSGIATRPMTNIQNLLP